MNKYNRLLIIFVFSILLFFIIFNRALDSVPVFSDTLNLTSDTAYNEAMKKDRAFLKNLGTNEVKVGAYVLNYKNLNINNGTCTIDFYFWLIWSNPELDPLQFEVMNAAVDYKDLISDETVEVEGRTFKWVNYRIVATTSNDFNFKNYPLDKQAVNIEIEDKELDISKMNYVISTYENSIDSRAKIQGWEIRDKDCHITTHKYDTNFGFTPENAASSDYSRYVLKTVISRPYFSSMLKVMLPLTVILSLSFISFFLSLDKYSQRISLAVSTVYTSVAFHINLSAAIPQVSYLTLADRLMISIYFMLAVSIVSIVAMTVLVDKKKDELALKINRILIILFPVLCFVVISSQFGK
ncbi:MAG TPA: hypothetical protein PKW98_14075 [Candidatus Wallbacteria bacterium]|nr:MAG: Cys-loop ligand-gated ion channel [bacterium ADurb.Bin243]HPG58942.1 hypothetical protein [Candidatus Wallbacteria bacterium]